MKESVLRDWFVKKAKERGICQFINNRDELVHRLNLLTEQPRQTELIERQGLKRAEHICGILSEDKFLFERESVAPVGFKSMSPDLVVVSSGGSYVLIELKTGWNPEREGVQELLAYSTAIKVQQPYVNEFIYVIVAGHWTSLLTHGVKALILDGKNVLPLQWAETAPEQFSLTIRLDLFRFDVHRPYDPWHAMVPHTLAIRQRGRIYGGFCFAIAQYFKFLTHKIVTDCERLLQSGFMFGWTSGEMDSQISSLTVVTVNQNWLYSEHTYGDISGFMPRRAAKFERLMHRVSTNAAGAIAKPASAPLVEDDPWASCAYYGEVAEHYPSSMLSFDLLQRHRDRSRERRVETDSFVHGYFEDGSVQNLEVFLEFELNRRMWSSGFRVCLFAPFGELADFLGPHHGIPDGPQLRTILRDFREHKRRRTA